jgi:HK97 gp10 family phage protein
MKVTGLNELKGTLAALPDKMEKKVLRKGLRAGAKDVLKSARAEAPKLSGALSKNIKIRGGRGCKGKIALSVGVGARDFKGPTFYGGFIIYGHRVGKRALGDKRHFVEPNNFLQRAFDATKETAVETTVKTWASLLDDIG